MDMPQPVRDLAIRGEVLTGVKPPEGRDVYAHIPPPASRRFRIGIILGHATQPHPICSRPLAVPITGRSARTETSTPARVSLPWFYRHPTGAGIRLALAGTGEVASTAANIFDLIYKGEGGGIVVSAARADRSPRPDQ